MLEVVLSILISFLMMRFLYLVSGKNYLYPLFLGISYWVIVVLFSRIISYLFKLYFSWEGILPVCLFIAAYASGCGLYERVRSYRKITLPESARIRYISVRRLALLIIVFSVIGLSAIFFQLNYLKLSIKSLRDLPIVAHQISAIRYAGGIDMPIYARTLLAFMYASGFFAGMHFVVSKFRILSVFPALVVVLYSMVNGVKASLLFFCCIWLSGIVVTKIFSGTSLMSMKRLLFKFIAGTFIAILMILLVQYMRNEKTFKNAGPLSASTISYFVSYNAFGLWWEDHPKPELAPFRYSLSGLRNVFYHDRQNGLYVKNVVVGEYKEKSVRTNVYTMNRGLIEDFSMVGATAILFLSGFMMTFLFHQLNKGRFWAMLPSGVCISILFCSFILNMLNFNTIILAWVIIATAFFLMVNKHTKVS